MKSKIDKTKSTICKLDTQVFSIGQVNKPYIRLTQENSIENLVQNYPPYILKPHGLY